MKKIKKKKNNNKIYKIYKIYMNNNHNYLKMIQNNLN